MLQDAIFLYNTILLLQGYGTAKNLVFDTSHPKFLRCPEW